MSGELVFWKCTCNVDLRFIPENFCSYVRQSVRWIADYQLDQSNFDFQEGCWLFFCKGFGVPEIPFYSVTAPIPFAKSRES
jgi:hypothetical protein